MKARRVSLARTCAGMERARHRSRAVPTSAFIAMVQVVALSVGGGGIRNGKCRRASALLQCRWPVVSPTKSCWAAQQSTLCTYKVTICPKLINLLKI